MDKYHDYVVIIGKCDEIPAKMYLAKRYSPIMLFISRESPKDWYSKNFEF